MDDKQEPTKKEIIYEINDEISEVNNKQEDKKNTLNEVVTVMNDEETPNKISYGKEEEPEKAHSDNLENSVTGSSEVTNIINGDDLISLHNKQEDEKNTVHEVTVMSDEETPDKMSYGKEEEPGNLHADNLENSVTGSFEVTNDINSDDLISLPDKQEDEKNTVHEVTVMSDEETQDKMSYGKEEEPGNVHADNLENSVTGSFEVTNDINGDDLISLPDKQEDEKNMVHEGVIVMSDGETPDNISCKKVYPDNNLTGHSEVTDVRNGDLIILSDKGHNLICGNDNIINDLNTGNSYGANQNVTPDASSSGDNE